MSEENQFDGKRILRMLEQILLKLNKITKEPNVYENSAFRFENADEPEKLENTYLGNSGLNPLMPNIKFIRKIIRDRQIRNEYFGQVFFSNPSWGMLLNLAEAQVEQIPVTVNSLCVRSGVPHPTALRWIGILIGADLVKLTDITSIDTNSRVALTDAAIASIALYFLKIDE